MNQMDATDHELLENFLKTADERSFSELVRRHLQLVHSAAMRITRSPVLAGEVSQLVFIKLARLRRPLKSDLPLVAWLHRTTRSTAINLVIAETRRRKREDTAASLAMNETSIPWERMSLVLDDVIDTLSAADRHIVLHRYFEGRSHAEIARALGLSEDALRMRVNRAIEKIRALLQKRGITTTASALALILPANAATAVPAGLAASVVGKAIVSSSGAMAFIKIGTITMTKKTVTIAAAVMLFVGAGTALFVTAKDPVGSSSSSSGFVQSGSTNGGRSVGPIDPSQLETKGGVVGKRRASESENELVSKYGDARVKLAKHVTASILHLAGEDGMISVAAMMASGYEKKNLADLAETIQLTNEQKKQAEDILLKIHARERAGYAAKIAHLNEKSTDLTEGFLAGDAFKRNKIAESEFHDAADNLDQSVMDLDQLLDMPPVDKTLDDLIGRKDFIEQLNTSLGPDQQQLLADLVDDRRESGGSEDGQAEPDGGRHHAKKRGADETLSLRTPRTLEDIDKRLSTLTSMVDGMRKVFDGMNSIEPK